MKINKTDELKEFIQELVANEENAVTGIVVTYNDKDGKQQSATFAPMFPSFINLNGLFQDAMTEFNLLRTNKTRV